MLNLYVVIEYPHDLLNLGPCVRAITASLGKTSGFQGLYESNRLFSLQVLEGAGLASFMEVESRVCAIGFSRRSLILILSYSPCQRLPSQIERCESRYFHL